MALNFPNSPSLNDLHEENQTKWRWNGSSWIRVVTTTAVGAQGLAGAQGAAGAQRVLLVERLSSTHLAQTQQIVILVQGCLNLIMRISHQRQFST